MITTRETLTIIRKTEQVTTSGYDTGDTTKVAGSQHTTRFYSGNKKIDHIETFEVGPDLDGALVRSAALNSDVPLAEMALAAAILDGEGPITVAERLAAVGLLSPIYKGDTTRAAVNVRVLLALISAGPVGHAKNAAARLKVTVAGKKEPLAVTNDGVRAAGSFADFIDQIGSAEGFDEKVTMVTLFGINPGFVATAIRAKIDDYRTLVSEIESSPGEDIGTNHKDLVMAAFAQALERA